MRAVVFVRRSGARGLGHAGWAFDCGDGSFCVGSVENPLHHLRTPPRSDGFWALRTRDPIQPMRQRHYTDFKVISLAEADIARAWRTVAWVSSQPYEVFGHNCMDATYDVLRAYGVGHLPVPAHHWEPNHWFDCVDAPRYHIGDADVLLEQAGRSRAGVALPDLDSLITTTPADITPEIPTWRAPQHPDWHHFQADLRAAQHAPARKWRPSLAARLAHFLTRHHTDL
ncbi:hypothetical protein SE17_15710 [Kouleothrix aurantiaca]|uniref:DUF4105 domain-containing protein n=1 Tax=Kouleothrix aurantiaca TaxID=186479 RepID=A0A0P9D311_9CHLR|nr:hypothetical protein SE17_15710 [Kouleothrix aurantiaca]